MKLALVLSFLVFLAITALFGITAISTGKFDETTLRILITTAAASFYSLIGLACVAHLGKATDGLGKLGLVFCGLALAHAIYTTWISFKGFDVIQNRLALFIVGLAIGHACLMLLIRPRSRWVTALMYLAIGSVVLNTVFAISSVYAGTGGAIMVMGIVAIIATCTTIAAPALNISLPGSE